MLVSSNAAYDAELTLFEKKLKDLGWTVGRDPLHEEVGRCGWYAYKDISEDPQYKDVVILEPSRWDVFGPEHYMPPTFELELYYEFSDRTPVRVLLYSFWANEFDATWPTSERRLRNLFTAMRNLDER